MNKYSPRPGYRFRCVSENLGNIVINLELVANECSFMHQDILSSVRPEEIVS